jgi:hypothetical protein
VVRILAWSIEFDLHAPPVPRPPEHEVRPERVTGGPPPHDCPRPVRSGPRRPARRCTPVSSFPGPGGPGPGQPGRGFSPPQRMGPAQLQHAFSAVREKSRGGKPGPPLRRTGLLGASGHAQLQRAQQSKVRHPNPWCSPCLPDPLHHLGCGSITAGAYRSDKVSTRSRQGRHSTVGAPTTEGPARDMFSAGRVTHGKGP